MAMSCFTAAQLCRPGPAATLPCPSLGSPELVLTLKRSSWSPLFLQLSGQALCQQYSTQHRVLCLPGPAQAGITCRSTSPAAPAQLHQCPADTGAVIQQDLGAVGSCSSSWLPAETLLSVSHLWSSMFMVGQEGWSPTPHVHGKTWAEQFWDIGPCSSP